MFRKLIVILCLLCPICSEAKTIDGICNGCITVNVFDTEEFWGNVTGGSSSRGSYLGSTIGIVEIDVGKATNTNIGLFHISAIDLRGNPMSNSNLQTLDFISSTENYHSHRLYEFYYDQKFNNFDIIVGKIDFFSYFSYNENLSTFTNASMISSMVVNNNTYNMTNYGPAPSPGIIVKYENNSYYIEGGISSDNPYGGNLNTDFYNHNTDSYGTDMIFKGPMIYLEFMKKIKISDLDGKYYIGGFYDYGKQSITYTDHLHRGNSAYYFIVDQEIYKNKNSSINFLLRYMIDPYDSRTSIKYTIDAGLLYSFGNQYVGTAFSLTHANKNEEDMYNDHNEYRLEFMYGINISDCITIQPDIQYIIHPGSSPELKNELVLGTRVIFSY